MNFFSTTATPSRTRITAVIITGHQGRDKVGDGPGTTPASIAHRDRRLAWSVRRFVDDPARGGLEEIGQKDDFSAPVLAENSEGLEPSRNPPFFLKAENQRFEREGPEEVTRRPANPTARIPSPDKEGGRKTAHAGVFRRAVNPWRLKYISAQKETTTRGASLNWAQRSKG